MPPPRPTQRILPLLKDAFAPLGFFLTEIWQAAAPLLPDSLTERPLKDPPQTPSRPTDH